jgi:hypothetical protein
MFLEENDARTEDGEWDLDTCVGYLTHSGSPTRMRVEICELEEDTDEDEEG